MIYFDNAATTFPKPPGVARAVFRAVEHMGGNPGRGGHALALQSARAVYRVREQAAALFGLDRPENVIFTQNCTHALNLLVYGLLRQGDRVVISDLEHNSVWRPLCDLRRRGVITLEVAEDVLAERRAHYTAPEANIKTGWLARYARMVSSANQGAVLK